MSDYLVIGANGRVGSYLLGAMKASGMSVTGWGRNDCDLRNGEELETMLLKTRYQAVINCAAVSGIEACLDDPAVAHDVNVTAPQIMARCCAATRARLIHLSTDYVLNGSAEGLKDELCACRPVNVYGASKEEGEWRVRDENPAALIARVSWVFGNRRQPSFPESILQKSLDGAPVSAVADKDSMPTWVDDLSSWLIKLASDEAMPAGVMHLCQSGDPATWHDYACETLKIAGELGFALKNVAVSQQRLDEQAGFRDARPRHTAMSNAKLVSYLGQPVKTWQKALECCLRNYLNTFSQ